MGGGTLTSEETSSHRGRGISYWDICSRIYKLIRHCKRFRLTPSCQENVLNSGVLGYLDRGKRTLFRVYDQTIATPCFG